MIMRTAQLETNAKKRFAIRLDAWVKNPMDRFNSLAIGGIPRGKTLHIETGVLNQHIRLSPMTKGELRGYGFSARQLEALFRGSRSLKSCRRLLAGRDEEKAGLSESEVVVLKFGPLYGFVK